MSSSSNKTKRRTPTAAAAASTNGGSGGRPSPLVVATSQPHPYSRSNNTPTASAPPRVRFWSVLNFCGLLLNLAVFSATVFVYQRILANNHHHHHNTNQDVQPFNIPRRDISARKITDQLPPQQQQQQQRLRQLPQILVQDSSSQTNNHDKNDDHSTFHIIFSTGCNAKQNWQSYVLFHSIYESGQTGHVTRIASGCTHVQSQQLKEIFETQIHPMGRIQSQQESSASSRFHLHLTPEFGVLKDNDNNNNGPKKVTSFKYLNKPYGVAHWMEEMLGYSATTPHTKHDDTIIMLLDPDMIFLRPFINDFTQGGPELWRHRSTYPHQTQIQHGFPMAQEYGYGMQWYDLIIKNLTNVIPANELPSPLQNMTSKQLRENYAAGPPYMATARDFYALAFKWRQFSIAVHRLRPDDILGEMYSFSLSAAHLNLPLQLAHSFMVSTFFERAFQLIDPQDETEHHHQYSSTQMCRGIPTESKPHILHYCQRYALGKYLLGKYRMPETFVGHYNVTAVCASPLLAEPPDNVALLYDYYIDPDTHQRYNLQGSKWGLYTKEQYQRRMAFLVCEEAAALNRAAMYFKEQLCDPTTMTVNMEKTLIFHKSLELTRDEQLPESSSVTKKT